MGLSGPVLAQHGRDVWVGQTSDGQLTNAGADLSVPFYLPPSSPQGPLGGGWALNDPGFDNVSVPADGAFPLDPSADISFEVISMTPGLRMISPDLTNVITGAGQVGALGGSDLHVHWNFHVFSADHPDHEDHAHYSCTLQLVDNSGSMTPSAPFTLVFQTEDVLVGDVNLDGALDTFDLDAFSVVVADPASATSAERVAADANLDGVVNGADMCALTLALGMSGGFVRGDANGDLSVNIADAVSMLGILFDGGQEPEFVSALDANYPALDESERTVVRIHGVAPRV